MAASIVSFGLAGLVISIVTSQTSTQAVIGVSCDHNDIISVCKDVNSYCAGGHCACNSGFVADAHNSRCLNTVLGGACAVDEDCAMTSPASNCRDNQCLACNDSTYQGYTNCKDPYGCAYHEYNHKCWKYREIGEKCEHDEQCWIYANSSMTRDCDVICVCRQGFGYRPKAEYGVDKCVQDTLFVSGGKMALNGWPTLVAFTSITYLLRL